MAQLGIDLGTANSAAAIFFQGQELSDDNPFMVDPPGGTFNNAYIMPSYIAFDSGGGIVSVGQDAWYRYHGGSPDVIRHVKRLIGRTHSYVSDDIEGGGRSFVEFRDRIVRADDGSIRIQIGGRSLSVEEIAAYLLKQLVACAERDVRGETITGITISVPAGFDDLQRNAIFEAAKIAGIENPMLIEEPTAACLVSGVEGTTVIIDIGAGTTDVIVGQFAGQSTDKFRLIMTHRVCDDKLGGIDMDHAILDFLFKTDRSSPTLADIFPALPRKEKSLLFGAIENAKIRASQDGASDIALRLRVQDAAKRISQPLEMDLLEEIVHPLVYGSRTGDGPKGVRLLIEQVLLDLAGFDASRILQTLRRDISHSCHTLLRSGLLRAAGFDPESVATGVRQTVQEIDHLVLVGGPCRMKCVHDMLLDVFASNEKISAQIRSIKPENPFFMEAVARGAAIGGGGVTTRVPYNVSMYNFDTGAKTVVIGAGIPYSRNEPVVRSATLPVVAGGQKIRFINEKGSRENEWQFKEYILNVPRSGTIEVLLTWSERGTDSTEATIDGTGAGLPAHVAFPAEKTMEAFRIGTQKDFVTYLRYARLLRAELSWYRQHWARKIQGGEDAVRADRLEVNDAAIGAYVRKFEAEDLDILDVLDVLEDDLQKCEKLDPETLGIPTDEDLDLVLSQGYFTARRQLARNRWAIPPKAIKAITALSRSFCRKRVPSKDELIQTGEMVLALAKNSVKNRFVSQLETCLEAFKLDPQNSALGSQVATCLGALADSLPLMDRSTYDKVMNRARAYGNKY